MVRKSLDESIMDWQTNWNAKKEEQWKKQYAKEIELKRPMIFEEWVKGGRTTIGFGSDTFVV